MFLQTKIEVQKVLQAPIWNTEKEEYKERQRKQFNCYQTIIEISLKS